MPVTPNKYGKPTEAREAAVKIYENLFDKEFRFDEVKDLGITRRDLVMMQSHDWVTTRKGIPNTNVYKLKTDAINLIENYYKSDSIKACRLCGKTKKVCEFNLAAGNKDGISTICRECAANKNIKYREKKGC